MQGTFPVPFVEALSVPLSVSGAKVSPLPGGACSASTSLQEITENPGIALSPVIAKII